MFFCSQKSKESAEEMYGTAPEHDGFLLLENNEPWKKDALLESSIPKVVKALLFDLEKQGIRVLLIKNDRETSKHYLRMFYIKKQNFREFIQFRFELTTYNDLLKINFITMDSSSKYDIPQVLLCTNGKKDKCCSKWGYPTFNELSSQELKGEVGIWQSSHLGGDRFAACALITPYCWYYGRVQDIDTIKFIDGIITKQLILDNLRGKALYNGYAQAGEYFIRKKLDLRGYDNLQYINAEYVDVNQMKVTFQENRQVEHTLVIREEKADFQEYLTCSATRLVRPIKYSEMY